MSYNKETGLYEGYIYCITNNVNGKQYIGQTSKSIEFRYQQHQHRSTEAKYTLPLYNAMKKYGVENFRVNEISKYCENSSELLSQKLDDEERKYIIQYNCKIPNGYNILDGGDVNPTYLTAKTVYQFDYNGTLIQSFFSISKCCEYLGIKSNSISKHIKEKTSYRNYFWSFNDIIDINQYTRSKPKLEKPKKEKKNKIVYQFDLDGNLIKEFTFNEILKIYTKSQIDRTCYNKPYYRDGYIWLYKPNITDEILIRAKDYEYKLNNKIIRTCKCKPRSFYYKKVYQFSLLGEFIKEWTNETEASLYYTHNRKTSSLWAALHGFCSQAHGFMWSYTNKSPEKYKNRREKFGKPVKQYDLDFNYIRTFSSIIEASESVGSKSYQSISGCCFGKTHHSFGYIWRYEGESEDDPFLYYRKMGYMKAVNQFDMNGKYLNSYNNMIDIPNVKPYHVLACCEGKEKKAGGFIWKYKILEEGGDTNG